MFEKVLAYDTDSNSPLQIESVAILESIFQGKSIHNLVVDNYYFKGFSGTYDGKTNYTLHFTFEYKDFTFEFLLSYDQLEFYISNNSKELKKFCLEDTVEEEEMLTIFRQSLITNINQLTLKQISSKSGPFIRKAFSIAAFTLALIFTYLIVFEGKENSPPIAVVVFLLIMAAIAYFIKNEVVYIDKNDFVVKGEKILITDVISITKKPLTHRYDVSYYDDGHTVKNFTFQVDSFLFFSNEYMRKLQALVEKNHR